MNKNAEIDFTRCRPEQCSSSGVCPAAKSCTRHLLEQEEDFGSPMLLSSRMCSGCGTCVRTCPLGALKIITG